MYHKDLRKEPWGTRASYAKKHQQTLSGHFDSNKMQVAIISGLGGNGSDSAAVGSNPCGWFSIRSTTLPKVVNMGDLVILIHHRQIVESAMHLMDLLLQKSASTVRNT